MKCFILVLMSTGLLLGASFYAVRSSAEIQSFQTTQEASKTQTNPVLGNPSNATADENNPDNYLVVHDNFILSYNKSRGQANWVSWHLSASDIGDFRTNAFAPDMMLPASFGRIKPNDLIMKGYDRGHLCPSEDRSHDEQSNRETFLMSNMSPQASKLNRGTWKSLEGYEQKMAKQGSEEYIYAGCYGDKGTIKNKITIPTNCYKIIVMMLEGNNDLKRITKNTRVIAVDMPNSATIKTGWRNYRTTVDDLEQITGYDFLSTVPENIQSIIEARKDNN